MSRLHGLQNLLPALFVGAAQCVVGAEIGGANGSATSPREAAATLSLHDDSPGLPRTHQQGSHSIGAPAGHWLGSRFDLCSRSWVLRLVH